MQEFPCNLTDCFLCRHSIPEWKAVIALKKTTLHIKRGKQLFAEGEKVKGIFFIYSGSVKVHKQWIKDKDLILRFAKAGDIVGHRGLGGSENYPVAATALEDTEVCFIDNEFLEAILRTNISFTYKLMYFYASELTNAERRMRNLVHMEVKGRIADALLEIALFFGVTKDNYIAVTITRQDIASYAGTTYETIFKFFTELIREKVISTSGKSIRIDDADKLRQFVSIPG
ncbi:MAG TPA: Crp/Fnr family transcriptional regulator [Puia sp.]|nr:Crp/Fnr family transcriptional regulator [Puia sp.]